MLERRERKMKCQVSRRSSPTFSQVTRGAGLASTEQLSLSAPPALTTISLGGAARTLIKCSPFHERKLRPNI